MSSITNGESATPSNQDIGIINMEIYFPSHFVEQSELETHDGASTGKYTIGLGQTKMGFCHDNEDVISLCLTAVSRLMKKSSVGYGDIGYMAVGTETHIDQSKSVKAELMRLFAESGNHDVGGTDHKNACYGGTDAFLSCCSWVAAGFGDYALAVCGDIAVYSKGNARPTGGAGAVAMLIGRNAALIMDHGLTAHYSENVYDFYKPIPTSEYPVVDGKLSIECYLKSLDKCYAKYCARANKKHQTNPDLSSFDAVLFHTPFCKLVQKSFARLSLNDFVRTAKDERLAKHPGLESFLNVELENSYMDRDVEKAFMAHSKELFEAKTKPSLMLATNVGNMYTPSLYGGLISYIQGAESTEKLAGTRVACFSYGSGLVSAFFSLRVSSDASPMSPLSMLRRTLSDVQSRLESRTKATPEDFSRTLDLREKVHHLAPYKPAAGPEGLFPGTFYLAEVDDMRRRRYEQAKPSIQNGH